MFMDRKPSKELQKWLEMEERIAKEDEKMLKELVAEYRASQAMTGKTMTSPTEKDPG